MAQLTAKEAHELYPSGTILTKVKCYDGNTGNLVDLTYIPRDDDHDNDLYDAKQVGDGYFTETWKVTLK